MRRTLNALQASERRLLAAELRAALSAVPDHADSAVAVMQSSKTAAIHARFADQLRAARRLPPAERAVAEARIALEKSAELEMAADDVRLVRAAVTRQALAMIRARYQTTRSALMARQRHERAAFAVATQPGGRPHRSRIAIASDRIANALSRRRRLPPPAPRSH